MWPIDDSEISPAVFVMRSGEIGLEGKLQKNLLVNSHNTSQLHLVNSDIEFCSVELWGVWAIQKKLKAEPFHTLPCNLTFVNTCVVAEDYYFIEVCVVEVYQLFFQLLEILAERLGFICAVLAVQ